MPTSGSGTGFPGEPNIDKTDVSESDQMGLTSVQVPVGGWNVASDGSLWGNYLTPGNLWQLLRAENLVEPYKFLQAISH